MRRTMWTTVAVVALAALVTIPLMAQPPQGRGMGRGAGMGMGPGGPGGFGGPGGGPMAMLRGVDLTDAQRDQIRAIMDAHREVRPADRLRELGKELQLTIMADTPNIQKIDELKGAIAAGTAEELAKRIEVETKIVQILTPAQRAQARENIGKIGPPTRRGW